MTLRHPHTTRAGASEARGGTRGARGRLEVVLLAIGGYYVLAYLAVSLLRIDYPFELEWMEGVVLQHVRRILDGQPLFVAPSFAFVPLNYTPLYIYVAAGAAALAGLDFSVLRWVSWLATAACMVLMFVIVRYETRRWESAALAVGMFAATYRLGGAWFDIARADMLSLALVLAGAGVLRCDRTRIRAPLVAGVAFAAAVMAKQSALLVVAPLLVWSLFATRARGGLMVAAFGLVLVTAALVLEQASHGWFHYYTLRVALGHKPLIALAGRFPLGDIGWHFAIAMSLIAWAVGRRHASGRAGFYGALLLGCLGSAWYLRLFLGSYSNVLIPAYAAVAMATAWAWDRILRTHPRQWARQAAALAMVVQLGVLWWNPVDQVPTRADRVAHERLVDALRAAPGPVFVSSHGYLAVRAGKPSHMDVVPLMDVLKGGESPVERSLLHTLRDSLATHALPSLVMDNDDWLLAEALAAGYRVRGRLFTDSTVGWPVSGMRTRPEYVLTPPTAADTSR